MPSVPCPICQSPLDVTPANYGADQIDIKCPRCGNVVITGTLDATLQSLIGASRKNAALLSHFSRRMQIGSKRAFWDSDNAKRVIENESLPTPQEQADNLLRWVGENSLVPGEELEVSDRDVGGIMGSINDRGFQYIVNWLFDQGLFDGQPFLDPSHAIVTLSFAGWERYEQLKRGILTGRRAFMAMEYGHPDLDRVFNDYLRPAADAVGFALKRVDETPRAGLIDDRMRVEIQSSRFLIADLTHANNGAYWEAGYAEGLGKPVIYTCEKSAFDDASHFDTNHHLTVMWDKDDPSNVVDDLKATIRATIPEASRH